jgi:hypothetical protein
MNRIATQKTMPRIVAKINLSDDGSRRLHDFIRRMHTGRWPTLRALGMRQRRDGTIIEAVEWTRTAVPRYAVIEWRADGNGMRMKRMPSRKAALAAMKIG